MQGFDDYFIEYRGQGLASETGDQTGGNLTDPDHYSWQIIQHYTHSLVSILSTRIHIGLDSCFNRSAMTTYQFVKETNVA